MSYFLRIIFFTIIIFSPPLMALDYLEFSPNTALKIKGESCNFKDEIIIIKKKSGIEYNISNKRKPFVLDFDEDNGKSIVIADISGNGRCDLLGIMTGSSQVNEYYDFFKYKENDKTFNRIGVEASDPLIDNKGHKIISKYRSGPRWWRDSYCQKYSFKKCEEGFWFIDDMFVVKDLIKKKIYFVNGNDVVIQNPQIKLKNITKGMAKGTKGRILDVHIEEMIRLEIQFDKEKLWLNEEDVEIELTGSADKEIKNKSYLYKAPNKPTKMYLIKGDKVTLLDEKTDDTGQKWYFINYKGKKELNMWIKAEAVDLEPKNEPKPAEKPKAKKPEPVTKTRTSKPAEVAQVTLTTTPPKNAEIIKAEKAEPIKTAKGSTSFTLLASMFGLLSLRLKNIM